MPLREINWNNGPRDLRSFLCQWSSVVADVLNEQLPDGPPDAEMRFLAEMDC